MRSVPGLLVVAVIVLLSYRLYFSKMMTDTGSNGGPAQVIDVVGVKNDLIAIGQAERMYQAEHGSYASMGDLVSSGALTMRKEGRDGYAYDVETSAGGFRVKARCPSEKFPGCANYAIDQTMEVQTES